MLALFLGEEFDMTLEEIERRLQMHLEELDEANASPDYIVTFDKYKAVYDTLIALKQAQALERIATQLEDGQMSMLEGDNIVERLSRIGTILQENRWTS